MRLDPKIVHFCVRWLPRSQIAFFGHSARGKGQVVTELERDLFEIEFRLKSAILEQQLGWFP